MLSHRCLRLRPPLRILFSALRFFSQPETDWHHYLLLHDVHWKTLTLRKPLLLQNACIELVSNF